MPQESQSSDPLPTSRRQLFYVGHHTTNRKEARNEEDLELEPDRDYKADG
jgi:hypothetical protein